MFSFDNRDIYFKICQVSGIYSKKCPPSLKHIFDENRR